MIGNLHIAIFHYHMNPGGVTRIVESQVASLQRLVPNINITLLAGHVPDDSCLRSMGIEIVVDPRLNYLTESVEDPVAAAAEIQALIRSHVSQETVLHFHNLNLGKNPLVTYAVSGLAQEGFSVLNHAHDFAEDRPTNWAFLEEIIGGGLNASLDEVLYPKLDHYQLAVLTGFDRQRLLDMGIPKERVSLLPNPVAIGGGDSMDAGEAREWLCRELGLDPAKRIVTYPVRVIRRKNIGEYILWAALLGDRANWLVTQPPKNPVEIEPYEKWKQFCGDYEIALHFEVGTRVEYPVLMQGTDVCFSTSIQEGFGMVFLEPWLADKPVMGRNLAMVTDDFCANGIQFPLLYEQVLVRTPSGTQDFGFLEQEEQVTCILSVLNDNLYRTRFLEENGFVNKLLEDVNPDIISSNKQKIAAEYSLDNYGQMLHGIYSRLTGPS